MSIIQYKNQYLDKNNELYKSFIEKQAQNNVAENSNQSSKKSNKYLDEYVDTLKTDTKGFKIAGAAALALGGAGVLLGRNKNYSIIKEQIYKNLGDLTESSIAKNSVKGFEKVKLKLSQIGMGLYNQNVYSNVLQLKFVKQLNKLGSFKLGDKILNISRISLKETARTVKANYKNLSKSAQNVRESTQKVLKSTKNNLSPEEQIRLQELNKLLTGQKGEKGFIKLVTEVGTGFDRRTVFIRDLINKNNVEPHLKKYYAKSFNPKEITKSFKKFFGKDFMNKEILRENWDDTIRILHQNIKKTGGSNNNIGKNVREIENLLNKMDAVKNPSKEFKNIKNNTSSLITKYKESAGFEVNKYAGRELDLAAGGGLSEMFIPAVTGGILTHSMIKDSKKGERTEKFLEKGGVAFVGSLLIWGITSVKYGNNGVPAIVLSLATGIGLDKAVKKIFGKSDKSNKFNDKPVEENLNKQN